VSGGHAASAEPAEALGRSHWIMRDNSAFGLWSPRRRRPAAKVLDFLIEAIIGFLILATPFLVACAHSLFYSFLQVSAFLVGCLWIARRLLPESRVARLLGVRPAEGPPLAMVRPLALPLAVAVGVFLAQLTPLPGFLLRYLSPRTAAVYRAALSGLPHPWQDTGLYVISLRPRETLGVFFQFTACVVVLLVVAQALSGRPSRRRLAALIIAAGTGVALMGVVEDLRGGWKIFGWWNPEWGGSPFGPFIDRNHFAGYMVMVIPLALGALLAVRAAWRRPRPGLPVFLLRLLFLVLVAALGLMCAGLVMSRSRGGALGFLAALFAFVAFAWHGSRSWRRPAQAVAIALPLVAIALAFSGGDLVRRFAQIPGERITRLLVWRDTLRMWTRFPVAGAGLGAFLYAYPMFKRPPTTLRLYVHCNNEYLELLAEAGLLGVGALLWFAWAWARVVMRGMRRGAPASREGPEANGRTLAGDEAGRWLLVGLVAGVVGMAAHCFFEFNLQIPANAFLFCVLLGLAYGAAWRSRMAPSPRARTTRSRGRLPGAACILLLLALACAVIVRHQAFEAYSRFKRARHAGRGGEPAAVASLQRAIRLDPIRPEQRYALGYENDRTARRLYRSQPRPLPPDLRDDVIAHFDAARRAYEKAIRLSPSKSPYHFRLGRLYAWAAARRLAPAWDAAEAALRNAARFDPRHPTYSFYVGFYYQTHPAGRTEEAVAWFRRSLACGLKYETRILRAVDRADADLAFWYGVVPPHARARLGLGQFLLARGRTALAAKALEDTCALAGAEPAWIKRTLVADLARAGAADAAVRWARAWLPSVEDPRDLLERLVELLGKQGDFQGMLAAADRLAALSPGDVALRLKIAHAFEAAGRRDLAIRRLEACAAVRPGEPRVHHRLGELYEAGNRLILAEFHYKEARRLRLAARTRPGP